MSDEQLEPVGVVGKCPECGRKKLAESKENLEAWSCASKHHFGDIDYELVDVVYEGGNFHDLMDDFVDRIEEKPNIQLTHATIKAYMDETVRRQLPDTDGDADEQ